MPLLIFAAVLIFIIVLLKLKVPIGFVLYGAATAFLFLSGNNFVFVLNTFWDSFTSYDTNHLLAIVISIVILGKIMTRAGAMKTMISSVEQLFPNSGLAGAVLPAVVGLLPMPGGALLSAPMVDNVSILKQQKPNTKAVINYWFRHVWEYTWPMYPAINMAAALSGVSIGTIIAYQLPLSIFAIVIGLIYFRKALFNKNDKITRRVEGWASLLTFSSSFYPLPIVIILKFIIGLDFLLSLIIVVILTFILNFNKLKPFPAFFKSLISINTIILVEAVMAMQFTISVSGLSAQLVSFLSTGGLLLPVLTGTVAFIIGLLAGMTTAFVGIAFPLIAPLVQSTGEYHLGFLAYCCGFAGVMLSPTHLCLLLSKDYFNAGLGDVYRLLIIPTMVVLAGGIIIFTIQYM
ncbi:MAG: DUF401 family protein [candidate division Zixibacteria bacterium]|nr:DUF401 family protein [candidate division Zixibacteria bacterium]